MSDTATAAAPPKKRHLTERDLSTGVKWSVILHLSVAIFVLLKSLVFPSKPVVYVPTLRVDIVGLPDVLKAEKNRLAKMPIAEDVAKLDPTKLQEELRRAEKEAKNLKPPKLKTSPTETASPDELVLKPKTGAVDPKARERQMKNALARIEALAKISAESGGSAKEETLIKGNRISRGTSLSGDARESAQASYYDALRERLQENWALPVWVARQNLSAQVQIYITAQGRLENFRFLKLSGNAQFDDAVKRAIHESQPYPRPPAEIAQIVRDGITVGFPL